MTNKTADGLKEKHKEIIISIIRKNPHITGIELFGSRAINTYKPNSDIDLALTGSELTMTDIATMLSELEDTSIPYKIDLIRVKTIENKNLLTHIKNHGVRWL
jgi:predicted nucleotidyltransferase